LTFTTPVGLVLLREEGLVDFRRVEHRRVEDGVRPDQALVRQQVGAAGRLDHQQAHRLVRLQPPHGAPRQEDVVALADFEVPVVAEQSARALVDEQQVVAVGVARQVIHVHFRP
jgi:hypothetical protein